MNGRQKTARIFAATAFLAGAAAPFWWLSGCGTARRSEPIAGPLRLADADPGEAAALRGQQVFAVNCYQCHPAGEAGLGPALNDKPLPGFAIRTQVRQGAGAMPGFSESEISDQELDDLVDYLIALRHN